MDPTQQRALSYSFFSVLGPEVTQQQVFERCGAIDLLDHVIRGYSATIFAYGPTGSGKTFSIAGSPEMLGYFFGFVLLVSHLFLSATTGYTRGEQDGLIARCVDHLFDLVSAKESRDCNFEVRTSCMEIYNEQVSFPTTHISSTFNHAQ